MNDATRQLAMEQRLLQINGRSWPEDQSLLSLYGPQIDWQLDLQGHHLVLFPPSGEWLYLDPLHETWERTGFAIGEAIFEIQQGRLGAKPQTTASLPDPKTIWQYRTPSGSLVSLTQAELPQQLQQGVVTPNTLIRKPNTMFWRKASWFMSNPQSEATWPCPICEALLHEGQRFCSTCGTPVTAPALICPQCQHRSNPGARFCAKCGFRY